MATKTLEKSTTLNPTSENQTANHGPAVSTAASSYANVVNSLKAGGGHQIPAEMKERNDNNKENVLEEKSPEECAANTSDTTTPRETRGQSVGEVEDDDSFIPVASLTKKERRKEKRQQLKAARTEAVPGGKQPAGGDRKPSKKNTEKSSSNGNGGGSATSSDAGSTGGNNGQTTKGDEPPKKFVEAPIPAVNAWKIQNHTEPVAEVDVLKNKRILQPKDQQKTRTVGETSKAPDGAKAQEETPPETPNIAKILKEEKQHKSNTKKSLVGGPLIVLFSHSRSYFFQPSVKIQI
ncbi:hypothetical protein DMENIID0001_030550 [Sergentomyia squamirostris]